MKKLFSLFMALFALTLVACDDSDNQVQEPVVPETTPTVSLEEVSKQELTITFKVTSADATTVKWLVAPAASPAPTAANVLAANAAEGMQCGEVEANTKTEVTYTAPMAMGELAIYAAATDGIKQVLSEPLKWTPTQGGNDEPSDEPEGLELTLTDLRGAHYGDMYEKGTQSYYLYLSEKGMDQEGTFLAYQHTYVIELLAATAPTGEEVTVPTGMYSIDAEDSYATPNTFTMNSCYTYMVENEDDSNTLYVEGGEIVVGENSIEMILEMEDGSTHEVSYEGSLVLTMPGTDEPEPEELSVSLEKVSVEGATINFKVTSTGATEVKWLMQMALAPAPTTEYIMNPQSYDTAGSVTPNEVVEASASGIEGYDFVIYAAATDGTNTITAEPLKWTPTEGGNDEPDPEPSQSISTLKGDLFLEFSTGFIQAECYGPDEDYGTNKYMWGFTLTQDANTGQGHYLSFTLLTDSSTDITGTYNLFDPEGEGNFFIPGGAEVDGEEVYLYDSYYGNYGAEGAVIDQAPFVDGTVKIALKNKDGKDYYELDLRLKDDAKHAINGWIKTAGDDMVWGYGE